MQAEYDAITDAEDREDYLEMVQVFQQTDDGGYTTLEAVKSELGARVHVDYSIEILEQVWRVDMQF